MHHKRKGVFAFISDGILAAVGAAAPKIAKCHLRVWRHIAPRRQQPPLPQGQQGMGQQGELVGYAQGGDRGQAWRHSGTCIGDHWGHAGGLVGRVEGVGGMHGTRGHS